MSKLAWTFNIILCLGGFVLFVLGDLRGNVQRQIYGLFPFIVGSIPIASQIYLAPLQKRVKKMESLVSSSN